MENETLLVVVIFLFALVVLLIVVMMVMMGKNCKNMTSAIAKSGPVESDGNVLREIRELNRKSVEFVYKDDAEKFIKRLIGSRKKVFQEYRKMIVNIENLIKHVQECKKQTDTKINKLETDVVKLGEKLILLKGDSSK